MHNLQHLPPTVYAPKLHPKCVFCRFHLFHGLNYSTDWPLKSIAFGELTYFHSVNYHIYIRRIGTLPFGKSAISSCFLFVFEVCGFASFTFNVVGIAASFPESADCLPNIGLLVNSLTLGDLCKGVPRLLCAKTRFVSIAAIPHILFHMCRQIGFALRPTRISTNEPMQTLFPRCVFLDRINRIYKILAVCKCFWRFHNPDNPVNPVQKKFCNCRK